MSPRAKMRNETSSCFPRVSGDEPEPRPIPLAVNEFSPRERG